MAFFLMGCVMTDDSGRQGRSRGLRGPAVNTLVRFLTERGLSDDQIERALEYVEETGARTIREAFVNAMSRVLYSDEELAMGSRFTFDDASAAAK